MRNLPQNPAMVLNACSWSGARSARGGRASRHSRLKVGEFSCVIDDNRAKAATSICAFPHQLKSMSQDLTRSGGPWLLRVIHDHG
jgi:hypothetical protein